MPEPQPAAPPAPAASAFARVGLLVYTLLIVYASWYPFQGWRNNGLPPWDYLTTPLPHYWTRFDVATNIVAYVPLGMLTVFALYPQVRRFWAIPLAIAAGVLLSAVMEAVQTFLPSRAASNLDLLTNVAGACIGAIAGALLSHAFHEESRLLGMRRRWFSRPASRGLIVLGLWPLAQIYPQAYLFGHGHFVPVLSEWLSEWWSTPIDLVAILSDDLELSVEQYWLSETIITACGLTGAVLTLMCVLRDRAPRAVLVAAMVTAAVAAKSLASALIFGPDNAFSWITPGAEGGLLIALLMLCGLAFAPASAQRRVAGLALLTSVIVVNATPDNPYFVATLQAWVQGKFLNFNGAAQFLSLLWPFFALWFLWHPVHRSKQP